NAVDVRTLEGARARARNIELNELAVLIAHKAEIHIRSVNIPPWDRCIRIDSKRVSTLEGTCDVTGVRRIDRGEGAVPIPEETVAHEGRVSVPSRDRPVRVLDQGAERKGALKWPRACPRRIEDGNLALIGANLAVEYIDFVAEESRNG